MLRMLQQLQVFRPERKTHLCTFLLWFISQFLFQANRLIQLPIQER